MIFVYISSKLSVVTYLYITISQLLNNIVKAQSKFQLTKGEFISVSSRLIKLPNITKPIPCTVKTYGPKQLFMLIVCG